MKKIKKDIFLKLIFNIYLHNVQNDVPFLLERMKIERV